MSAPASLTEEEVRARAQLLGAYSSFDGDGILGFLHAQATGPGELPSLLWLPAVLDKLVGAGRAAQEPQVAEIVIVASCVKDRLAQKVPLVPGELDDARWASFAAGFVAYAELDLTWRASAKSWNYAIWAVMLAGRADLVPALTPQDFAMQAATARRTLRTTKANIVVLAYEDLHESPAGALRGPTRIGRNDACPCGSGKKFKKCCVDKGSAPPP
jgi:SEC-C motif